MKLQDYLNTNHLAKDIELDYVERKESACGNFYLLDYTRNAMFEGHYSDAVLKCRGLVMDIHDDTIVGMCLPKFHNLTEGAPHHLKQYKECIDKGMSFVATEKMDGSFGNIWWDKYQQKWRCSTRGSFESDQAIFANEYLNSYPINKHLVKGDLNFNLIVEIIYPENRVVVDYGDKAELVLLTGFNVKCEEFDRYELGVIGSFWHMNIVPTHKFSSIDEIVAKCETLDGNHEGYVLRFENGFRTKIKGKMYCELHKIISGLSTTAVYENIDYINYEIKKEWLVNVPEEFREQIEAYGKQIIDVLYNELMTIDEMYMLAMQFVVDEFGEAYTKKELVGILNYKQLKPYFSDILLAYGGKTDALRERIWKRHRPVFSKSLEI